MAATRRRVAHGIRCAMLRTRRCWDLGQRSSAPPDHLNWDSRAYGGGYPPIRVDPLVAAHDAQGTRWDRMDAGARMGRQVGRPIAEGLRSERAHKGVALDAAMRTSRHWVRHAVRTRKRPPLTVRTAQIAKCALYQVLEGRSMGLGTPEETVRKVRAHWTMGTRWEGTFACECAA